MQIGVVATARKLAMLRWHLMIKGEDYVFARPSLVAHKQRKLELRAGLPIRSRTQRQDRRLFSRRGQSGMIDAPPSTDNIRIDDLTTGYFSHQSQ